MTTTTTNGSPKSIIIADDHVLVRHAIRMLLEKKGSFTVLGEASNADETVRMTSEMNPDLLLLDLSLPGKSGLEAMHEISRAPQVKTKIVVLTMFEDEATIRQAFTVGAKGYVCKNSQPSELFHAIEVICNDEVYVPAEFEHLKEELSKATSGKKGAKLSSELDPLGKLSKREREVFYLLADGMPNRVIAKQLYISPRTVETHRARVIKKLGFQSTADLIRYAIRNNLLSY